MAKRTWIGGTSGVAQVVTVTINTSTAANTYSVVFTDEVGGTVTITYTAADTNTTNTATGLKNAINASTDPRVTAVTATSSTNVVTITADSAGVPFYPALGGTGSAQMTLATTTVNQGPNDFNTPANWQERVVPVGGDDVTITGSNAIYYGVKTGLTFGAFLAAPGCSAPMGKQGINFSFICTSFNWYGTGVSWVDILTSAITPNVFNTASQSDPACGLNLYGSAMTTLSNYGGSVGLAMVAGSTSTATTIQHVGANAGNARTRISTGTTVTNVLSVNGAVILNVAATTVTASGGTLVTNGSGAITTINNNGAALTLNSTGTITTLNNNLGTADFTKSNSTRTVTNPKLAGGSISYDPSIVTFTNPIVTNAIGPQTISSAAA